MKNFWGQGAQTLLFSARFKEKMANVLRPRRTLAAMVMLVLSLTCALTASAQDTYESPMVITNVYGSITNDNTGVIAESGAPTIAGYVPNAPLWYSWTAPQSGEVEFDTIGSTTESSPTNVIVLSNIFGGPEYFNGPEPLDTVIGVYTGSSLSSLSQVAANDDLYPVPQQNENYPETIFDLGASNVPVLLGNYFGSIVEPYSGPSGLRFNAVGGQTYYIAVDSKSIPGNYTYGSGSITIGSGNSFYNTGPIVLTWAFKPSGVFRFATENFDQSGNLNGNSNSVPLPLIVTAQNETTFSSLDVSDHGFTYDVNQYNIQLHSYYPYNVQGVPVTITRVGGSSGRVWVSYTTEDGNTNLPGTNSVVNTNSIVNTTVIQNGDQPAVAGVDYTPETNQTLIFDDGEMSKTIYIPINPNRNDSLHPNRDFTIAITGVQLDPYEDGSGDLTSVSPPRIDSNFGKAEVRILDVGIDPKGPSTVSTVVTNSSGSTTNVTFSLIPTNAVLNFAKANYRFPRDVTNYWKSAGSGTLVTIWVTRRGTNTAGVTANWVVDAGFLNDGSTPGIDDTFPLEPASDYANPNPAGMGGNAATNSDFSFSAYRGTVSFPDNSGGHAWDPQPIQFLVYDQGNVTLDKDFIVDLYEKDSKGNILQAGMVAQTKVTILADRAPASSQSPPDGRFPAGSVDEQYNPDFGLDMAPTINTSPQNNPVPGTDGEVDGLVVLPNNETLAVGTFDSYNGTLRYGICLIGTNGVLDQSFNPGAGVNVRDGYGINCVAPTANYQQFYIGGSFTSYNGLSAGGIARVNLNGSLDQGFQATVNGGTVYSLAVQPNGQILIGGDFTEVDGQNCAYVARLNADGSLDTSFNPGNTLNGPVFALSTQQSVDITNNVISTGGPAQENDWTANVNPNDAGNVIVTYDFPTTNELLVLYGNNIIYDTGPTVTGNGATPVQVTVPYGPGSSTVEVIVNPGGNWSTGTSYSYAAAVTGVPYLPEVMVGGNFSVNGQNFTDIALLNSNGVLDTSFNPTLGADQPIYAMDWQPDGKILIGGNFQNYNATPINRFARINPDGSLDTTNFFVGYGADDTVFSINYVNPYTFSTNVNGAGVTNVSVTVNRAIYIGGQFSSYNGTHRLGFARLYLNGTVDTTFLDTTYNQFAGLPKIYSYDAPAVHASGLQSDGNVMIGGYFDEVGGGEADFHIRDEIDTQLGIAQSFSNKWLWVSESGTEVEPNARDGVRNRGNIARLIGGSTAGPGNLSLVPDSSAGYQANRNQVIEPVGLVRTNGLLGPESANFSIIPGTAQGTSDLLYESAPPLDYLGWEYVGPTRMHTDGLNGPSGYLYDDFNQVFSGGIIDASEVNVTILPDVNVAGNLTATYQLANPANADQLYLGGEDIAQAQALGQSSSLATFIDNSQQAGTFGFESSTFVATNLSPQIFLIRQNGDYNGVTVNYFTNAANGGTAVPNVDYAPISLKQSLFTPPTMTNWFNLTVLNNGIIYTNFTEKTINLQLGGLRPAGNGAALGISNATVRLINPNFPGYLTLSASNYFGSEAPPAGQISFTVNRVAGNQGSLSVQYATADGSAINGVDYIGATNTLSWNAGDASPRTITLVLKNTGVVSTNKQFSVSLSNPQLNGFGDPALFYLGSPGSIAAAAMIISNNNSYGSVQFSANSYLVNENGGYATITVVRSGGVGGPAYVNYYTSDGTAYARTNYLSVSNTLTFAANQLSATFEVPITNNGQAGPAPSGFYFNVNLSNPVNLALGAPTNAQVNILNDQTYNQPPGSTNGTFSANINGEVLALAYQTNGQIVAAGSFSSVNGLSEQNIVCLNTNGVINTAFTGSANGTIQAIVSQPDDRILVGGDFTFVGGFPQNYIARVMTDGTVDSSFDVGAGADGPVYALAETYVGGARKVYAGGAFSEINSGGSPGITRLNDNGTPDTTFVSGFGADGTVYAIAVYPTNSVYAGDILIGGSFVHYNGTIVNGIVRLQSNGSIDIGFNPGTAAANGVINAITIQPDGRILIGGSFTNFDGTAANNIARLNDDGSTDTNFASNVGPGASDIVYSITLQPDNRILVTGQFPLFDGLVRNGITRLLTNGVPDPTINFGTGANGAVNAAMVDPVTGLITLGGGFTAFNGAPAGHIIQLYGLSETGSGAFEFSSSSYQVAATGIVAPITIIRVGGTSGTNSDGSGNVYVNFSTATNTGTAVPGVDYVPVSTNVAFPPGAVVETVNVPILGDFLNTNNLTVGLLLTNATPPAAVTNQPTALLTILSVYSTVSFASSSTNVSEAVQGGVVNIPVIRQGATNFSSSVTFYTTTNGTAVPNVDYYPTNETITFNPGVAQQAAQVLIISNNTLEKTVGMALSNAVETALIAPTNETLTIIDNTGSAGQLCFAATNYVVNESAGSVTLTVIRTNGFAGTVTYGYMTVPGTAQSSINYQSESKTVTFSGLSTTATISIPILQNNPPEGPVSFSVILTNNQSSAATLISPSNTTVTIIDDVSAGAAFVNATNYFEETNATISVLVQRVGALGIPFSVPFATTPGTAIAGTNGNYLATSGVVPFTANESVAGINLTLFNRTNVNNVTFGISLYPTNDVFLYPSNTLVEITPSGAGITFASPTNTVYKGTNYVLIPVVCLDPSNEPPILNSNTIPLSVSFTTTDGTGLAGVDYVATNGVLVFTNGIATNNISVQILNNNLISGDRTFGVYLYNPQPVPPAELIQPTNEVITVIDDNSGLSFASPNYSINSGGNAVITVVRVDNTNTTSTVNYATTAGGSAVINSDYYPTNGTLTFYPGQTSTNFEVTIIGSSLVEPDKTILLALSSPSNIASSAPAILTAPSAATLTIYNQNGSYIVPAGVSMDAHSPVPNGILQSGQQALLYFAFRDAGGLNVSSMTATILPSANIVNPSPASQPYSSLTVNGPSRSAEFTLTPIGTNGQTIAANFKLQVTATNNVTTLETNSFALTIGTFTTTFSNTNAIVISPDSIAAPYPSIITVSNVGGVLVGVTATLTNFSDTSPKAVSVLLVSPAQKDTLLMSGVGTNQVAAYGATLTFSNSTPLSAFYNPLPATNNTATPITNGVYTPTQYGAQPVFP